jgi:hypothetical protein
MSKSLLRTLFDEEVDQFETNIRDDAEATFGRDILSLVLRKRFKLEKIPDEISKAIILINDPVAFHFLIACALDSITFDTFTEVLKSKYRDYC